MGGYGSGARHGRPTAESCLRIDLAWMLRTGRAEPGKWISGTLHWTCRDQPSGSIGYQAIMHQPGAERLELAFARETDAGREQVRQTVPLRPTTPHYGGKRWWMICPASAIRAGVLYLPPGGDRFASRQAWQLGYHCQRIVPGDRPFERLFRLQKRLGCQQGWEAGLRRPKGMWQRTYARHEARYLELDAQCAAAMEPVLRLLERLRAWKLPPMQQTLGGKAKSP
jgi:hypothetical protein